MTADAGSMARTIRAWRDRLSPEAAGLPVRLRRRTSGLRREELADLAGLSVDYVVRLEQGRATSPSAQVVAALARALQLTTPERDHLYVLAGLVAPGPGTISDHIPPGVQRFVARAEHAAVAVFAADWQLIWCNRAWVALFGDPSSVPARSRNFARDRFPVAGSAPVLSRWPVTSADDEVSDAAVVSDLRRATGRFPADDRLAGLVAELRAGNERFARLWSNATVAAHREDHKTVDHPAVGPILVDCDVLTDGDLDLKIVVLSAQPHSDDESKLRLALVAGSTALDVEARPDTHADPARAAH